MTNDEMMRKLIREKFMDKKPYVYEMHKNGRWTSFVWTCPTCQVLQETIILDTCPECGQHLDWRNIIFHNPNELEDLPDLTMDYLWACGELKARRIP